MERVENGIVMSNLLRQVGVVHGTSTKELGNMSFDRSQKGRAPANFKKFVEELGIDLEKSAVLILNVKHTANLAQVQLNSQRGRIILRPDSPEIISYSMGLHDLAKTREYDEGIDAAVSNSPNLYLAVLHADCAPLILYDPANKQFALVHAGILGAFNGIAGHTVKFMAKRCQTDPGKLLAYIGPSICGGCYKLETSSHWDLISTRLDADQKKKFEIKWAICDQLINAGLTKLNIEMSGFCTSSSQKMFYSNHRSGCHKYEGRNMTIIGLR